MTASTIAVEPVLGRGGRPRRPRDGEVEQGSEEGPAVDQPGNRDRPAGTAASACSLRQNRSAFAVTSSTLDIPDHRRTRSRTGCSQRMPWLSLRHTAHCRPFTPSSRPTQDVEQHRLPRAGLPDQRHPVKPACRGSPPHGIVEGRQLVLPAHDRGAPGGRRRRQRLELEDLDGGSHALELAASERGPGGDAGGVAEDARVHDQRPGRGAVHQPGGQVDVGAVAAEADLHRGSDEPAERGAHRRPGAEHHGALRPQGQQQAQGPLDVPGEGDRGAPVEQDHPPLLGPLDLVQHATVGLDEPEDVTDEPADVLDRRVLVQPEEGGDDRPQLAAAVPGQQPLGREASGQGVR